MSINNDEKGAWRQVYYLGSDSGLQLELGKAVAAHGIEVSGFQDSGVLAAACANRAPEALLLDMSLLPAEQTFSQLLNGLLPAAAKLPALICITDEHGIEWRLQAIRTGAQAFFSAPVQIDELAQKLVDLVAIDRAELRVLIVEDDRHQSRVYAQVLGVSGMAVKVLSSPLRILESIGNFHPDLILMDLYMPGASGAELARIIRDHDLYYDIPIIYLSAEADLDRQLEALRLGGDSFLCKPVNHRALIGAVRHRVAMHRWFKARWLAEMRRKEASGLIRKRAFLSQVDRVMRAPEPSARPWGLLVVEMDAPQRLLRTLGISGTEQLMQGLGPRIAAHLADDESATRVGDFRYALLARREGREEFQALAGRIAESVRVLSVESDEGPVRPTVSIGIGPFSPPASDAITLISRAHMAARLARRSGGDQVAHWAPKQADSDAEILPLVDRALSNEGFQLYFQPILSVRQRRGELYEALLRLHSPDSELIPPLELFQVADKHGKGNSVDRWVLSHALDVLENYRERRQRLRLLVHQKLETLAAPEWLSWFRNEIVERDLIKQRPLLVLQAHELSPGLASARSLMPELIRLGVDVCVANVTGAPEQLEMLEVLEIRLVKLPLNRIAHTGTGAVEGLAEWLRKRKVSVIAAGVEDANTLALAWRIRPAYVQGNFLKMPSAELGYDLELDIGRMA